MTPYKSKFDTSLKLDCFLPKYWGSWCLLGLLYLFSYCPIRMRDRFAGWVASKIYNAKLFHKRKKIAFTNLSLCFPDLTESQKDQIMRDNIRALAQISLSLGEISFRKREFLLKRLNISGEKYIQEAEQQNKGIIFLSPHCYGIDYSTVAVTANKYPVSGMFKHYKNPVFDWFVSNYRSRFAYISGKGALYHRSEGFKPIIKGLLDKTHFYYLPDEDHGRDKSIFSSFFAAQKATLPVIGRLAKLGKAVIIPTYASYNEKTAKYDISFHPPLTDIPTGDEQKDTQLMNKAIEKLINENPSQYMWSLKLLKTRPEVGLNIYK